jgi:hypothetical protein
MTEQSEQPSICDKNKPDGVYATLGKMEGDRGLPQGSGKFAADFQGRMNSAPQRTLSTWLFGMRATFDRRKTHTKNEEGRR